MITRNASDIINISEFEQFYEDVCVEEVEILKELVTDLREEGQELVDSVLTSFKSENLEVLQRSAHTLKSSTKIFGGVLISQQAAQIELLADPDAPGDFGTVATAVSNIQENFDSFLVQLDQAVASKEDN